MAQDRGIDEYKMEIRLPYKFDEYLKHARTRLDDSQYSIDMSIIPGNTWELP